MSPADIRRVSAGISMPLVDGIEKVTGRAQFTADLPLREALVGRIVRSPVPHGVIRSIDITRASACAMSASRSPPWRPSTKPPRRRLWT